MPRRKFYRKKRRKRTRRVTKKGVKTIYKIAKKVAQIQIQKQAQPLYVDTLFGSLDQYGAISTTFDCTPGPNQGNYLEWPQVIAQPITVDTNNQITLELENGRRKDSEINLTGWSLAGQLLLPNNYRQGYFTVYIGTTKLDRSPTHTSSETLMSKEDFSCPDGTDNVSDRNPNAKGKRRIYFKKTYSCYNSEYKILNGHGSFKRISHYKRFKKPIRIKFNGDGPTDYETTRLYICFKCHLPGQTGSDAMKFQGRLRCYYRDL